MRSSKIEKQNVVRIPSWAKEWDTKQGFQGQEGQSQEYEEQTFSNKISVLPCWWGHLDKIYLWS